MKLFEMENNTITSSDTKKPHARKEGAIIGRANRMKLGW